MDLCWWPEVTWALLCIRLMEGNLVCVYLQRFSSGLQSCSFSEFCSACLSLRCLLSTEIPGNNAAWRPALAASLDHSGSYNRPGWLLGKEVSAASQDFHHHGNPGSILSHPSCHSLKLKFIPIIQTSNRWLTHIPSGKRELVKPSSIPTLPSHPIPFITWWDRT